MLEITKNVQIKLRPFQKMKPMLENIFSRDELLHSNPKDLVSMQQKIVQLSA